MKKIHYCSPVRYELGVSEGTCLTKSELSSIAKETVKDTLPLNLNKKQLYKKVKATMKPKCGKNNNETCWLENVSHSTKEKLSNAYRPRKPKAWLLNPRTWLNTYDILHVMMQYEDRYKNFKFLGVHPIDFADKDSVGRCVGDNLCNFSIKSLLEKGKKRFGMVLNLDDHRGDGYHWVAMFCVFDPNCASAKTNFGIYYYDSVADKPDSHNSKRYTMRFMKEVESQVQRLYPESKKSFEVRYNKVRKQFKGTECGVFSQVFITQMLKNLSFDYICDHMPRDDDVQKLRDIIYSPSPS